MKNKLSGFVKSIGHAVSSAADAATAAADTSFIVVNSSAGKAGQSVLELGRLAGGKIGHAAEVTGNFTSKAGGLVSERAEKSYTVLKHGANTVGQSASAGAKSAGAALGVAADAAGNALGALGVLVGDLNGDGKVDFEDAKIAAAKVRDVAGATAVELGQLGKKALQSQLVQDTAAGAAVGGVLASMIPIPFLSTVAGATAGAAFAAYKSLGKK